MPDWGVGAVLVAGFLAMLLLDQLQHKVGSEHGHMHGHGHGRGTPHLRSSDDDLEEGGLSTGASPSRGVGKVGFSSGLRLSHFPCLSNRAPPLSFCASNASPRKSEALQARTARVGHCSAPTPEPSTLSVSVPG